MKWYETVSSLIPVVVYDAKSNTSEILNNNPRTAYKIYLSRLSSDINLGHALTLNLVYSDNGQYKYFLRSPARENVGRKYRLVKNIELGENWLIYYRIQCIDYSREFPLYMFIENDDHRKQACFWTTNRNQEYFIFNGDNPTAGLRRDLNNNNFSSLLLGTFFDIFIQKSIEPAKCFISFNGAITPLDGSYLPTKITSIIGCGLYYSSFHEIKIGDTFAAFKGNVDPSEMPQFSAALETEINQMPDPTINIFGGIESIPVATRDPNAKPHINVSGDVFPLSSSSFSLTSKPIGKIEGTVHEVFPPDPKKPVKRRVICIDQTMNAVIAETWSRPDDGYYVFGGLDKSKKYTVLAYDYTGNFTAICCDNIVPQ